ncbi:MAG TPA: hypothetical protein VMH87_10065 [Pseudomonadales bacterium]|nr:hypothetical protein [Pseudomonadales bacterium]
MKSAIMICCCAGLLTWGISMSANAGILAENPYTPIAVRNVFALNTVPLQQPPAQPVVPLARISLVGITTILNAPEVLFKVSNPGEPGKPGKSYISEEGQIQDDVEVMSIDVKDGLVAFKNHGVIQKISFESGPVASSH